MSLHSPAPLWHYGDRYSGMDYSWSGNHESGTHWNPAGQINKLSGRSKERADYHNCTQATAHAGFIDQHRNKNYNPQTGENSPEIIPEDSILYMYMTEIFSYFLSICRSLSILVTVVHHFTTLCFKTILIKQALNVAPKGFYVQLNLYFETTCNANSCFHGLRAGLNRGPTVCALIMK